MQWYSVRVQARGEPARVPDDARDRFMDLLQDLHGTVGATNREWDATISLFAGSATHAAEYASAELLPKLAEKAGFPPWPVVRVEAVQEDVLDEELERSNFPDLVSGPEAAAMLKVSRQRLHQLAMTSRFPKPLYELGAGKLWHRAAVERFAETWERKPGRPAKRRVS